MGSVSQIGWEWYSRLARRTPVTLFTHIRNRATLEAAGAPVAGSEIRYIDTEWFAGPLYRAAKMLFPRSEHAVFLMSSLDYFPYDTAVLRQARASGERWDVVHQVTPVSPSAITRLGRLGKPLVIGPLNGGLQSPSTFPELMKADSGWVYALGRIPRMLDGLTGSSADASRILVANDTTRQALPQQHRGKCATVLENGVDLDVFRPQPWPGSTTPLRVLFVGRLIPVKGVNFLIEAVRRLQGELPVRVTVAGDGPMKAEWERLAESAGVGREFHFLGNRPLSELPALHAESHVFCLPSVRESGGAVLLEAMACARPVIAVRYGGPAVVTDSAVGAALPPDGPEALTGALVEALRDVARRPDAWRERGLEGRRRAEAQYSWDARIEQALRLYRDLA
jgi:glycosyltransferase involved in cell wall biosynthesis